MSEDKRYLVTHQNAIYGPYTFDELKYFVTPGTLICIEGEHRWHAAGELGGRANRRCAES